MDFIAKYLPLTIFLSFNSFALTIEEDFAYTELYSSELLEKFDQELNMKLASGVKDSTLNSQTYAKLLSLRDRVESFQHSKYRAKHRSFLQFDENTYKRFKDIIKIDSSSYQEKINKSFKENDLLIYPSVNLQGNVTGNNFPENTWAFTFDDGPHITRSKKISDTFYRSGVSVTFFVLTQRALKEPKIMQDLIIDGHKIALHSYTHPNLGLSTVSNEKLNHEIIKAKNDLEELVDKKISLYRLPYGAGMRVNKVREKIADADMVHIFWNIDTLDWKDKNPSSIVERALKQMLLTPNNSGIILFHDIHEQSVIASKMLLDEVFNRGDRVCELHDIINYMNKKPQGCLK